MSYKQFGLFRSAIWPIHRHECGQVLLLMTLFFFASANYHLLRQIKDNAVLLATGTGMEVMPFIKGFLLFPVSFFFVYLVSLAKKYMDRKTIVYATALPFLLYFFCVYFWIYPYRETLRLDQLADILQTFLPLGLKGFVTMVRHWYISLFFAMAELWGTLILQVALWGFVNDQTPWQKAKRIYIPLNFSINLAGVVSGILCKTVLFNPNIGIGKFHSIWEQGFYLTLLLVLMNGSIALFLLFNLTQEPSVSDAKENAIKAQKNRISFFQNVYSVFSQQHTLCLASTVFSFGFITNTLELFWKEQVRQLYALSDGTFSIHIATIMTWTALISTCSSVLLSGSMMHSIPWRIGAMIPPFVVGSSCLLFFSLATFPQAFTFISSMLAITQLELTVFSGNIAICLARISKYVIFDLMKELAYIPLCPHERLQAKAIIDGVVSRTGKVTSAISLAFFMSISGSIYESTVFAHICCTSVSALWTYATVKLSVLVQEGHGIKEHKSQD